MYVPYQSHAEVSRERIVSRSIAAARIGSPKADLRSKSFMQTKRAHIDAQLPLNKRMV